MLYLQAAGLRCVSSSPPGHAAWGPAAAGAEFGGHRTACHPLSRDRALGWQDKVQPPCWEPGCVPSLLRASVGVNKGRAQGP